MRVSDIDIGHQSNSPALTRLFEMILCALFQAGHFFTQESTGLTSQLARLLNECGCQQVKTEVYALAYRAGTPQGENFYQDMRLLFKTSRPFIQKWGCGSEEYDSIYRQALKEMRRPDSLVVGNMITVWGRKP